MSETLDHRLTFCLSPMLFRLSDIYKSYGGSDVLRGVTFQVNPGEKIGLVGRNGAGKTTAFRLITGAEEPDRGDVIKMNNLNIGLLEQHVDFSQNETVHTAALSAFKKVHDIEARMRLLEKQMETDASEAVLNEYAEAQIAFEQADGYTYAARAESILLGLGFPREAWTTDTQHLSGGQRNRLGMARLLLSSADVLLLDEPTNHLDVNAVEWLEEFLQGYDGTFVAISHDRYFLDRTTNRIIELDGGKAFDYKGNYSKFVVERELRREQQAREFENQRSYIAKTEEFIRRNLEGQKTKQAKSRRNMLQRMERLENVTSDRSGGNFQLKEVTRTGNNVLTAEELAIGFGTKVLASDISFSLHRGEALGVIGSNGTGKTTLLRTLLGELREISGKVVWGTKIDIGFYSQNLEDLDGRNEVIQELRRVAPFAESGDLRSFLSRFLFVGDDVFKRVADLSGGEKGRLALAKLIYSRKNVLVLDEPTNHLDIPSREALETALAQYTGTIVTVSHDRFFLDKVATQMLSFESDGSVKVFHGNYSEFHDWKERDAAPKSGETSEQIFAAAEKTNGANKREVPSTLSKNQRQRLETRIKQIEDLIPAAEKRAARLAEETSSPAIASDYGLAQAKAEELKAAEAEVRELYEEWQRLSDEVRD